MLQPVEYWRQLQRRIGAAVELFWEGVLISLSQAYRSPQLSTACVKTSHFTFPPLCHKPKTTAAKAPFPPRRPAGCVPDLLSRRRNFTRLPRWGALCRRTADFLVDEDSDEVPDKGRASPPLRLGLLNFSKLARAAEK